MTIMSWDVGVKNLAFCIIDPKNNNEIKDWDIINLVKDQRVDMECTGVYKNNKSCTKKALYSVILPDKSNKIIGFCKTHLHQADSLKIEKTINSMFKKNDNDKKCEFCNTKKNMCGKKSKYIYNLTVPLCTTHYKSILSKNIKNSSPQKITNKIIQKIPTSILQMSLINNLDKMKERFSKSDITQVIIENQPSQKNPKMKSIANTLFDYFLIRGIIDKSNEYSDINLVRFICPSNKLKLNNENTLQVFKSGDKNQKYKLTKSLGIQYTKQFLADDPENLLFLSLFKKKDDLCDAYLQGIYYITIISKLNVKK